MLPVPSRTRLAAEPLRQEKEREFDYGQASEHSCASASPRPGRGSETLRSLFIDVQPDSSKRCRARLNAPYDGRRRVARGLQGGEAGRRAVRRDGGKQATRRLRIE